MRLLPRFLRLRCSKLRKSLHIADFGAPRAQNSAGVRCVHILTRKMSAQRSFDHHYCAWRRDGATSAIEIAQIFARKRANALQLLVKFGAARMQNSTDVQFMFI